MPRFITQGRYTHDAWKGMIAKPEDRAEAPLLSFGESKWTQVSTNYCSAVCCAARVDVAITKKLRATSRGFCQIKTLMDYAAIAFRFLRHAPLLS